MKNIRIANFLEKGGEDLGNGVRRLNWALKDTEVHSWLHEPSFAFPHFLVSRHSH